MHDASTAEQVPPAGRGLMIVNGMTAVVVGEPGRVHAEFFALVKHLAHEFNKAGRPLSGDQA